MSIDIAQFCKINILVNGELEVRQCLYFLYILIRLSYDRKMI